jgi:hypothetical protein
MNKQIQQGKYRHYKGKEYEVIGTAIHSETLEEMVIYKAFYASDEFGVNSVWVRPLSMFTENVEVAGATMLRFEYVGK